MRTLNQKIKMVCFVLLCNSMQTWGYTNPIDGSSTETVTDFWDLGSEGLQVGLTTDSNTLIVTNGGRVESGGGVLGNDRTPYSTGNRVVVTGIGSIWINSGDLTLSSKDNELLITDGGRVDSISGQVGSSGSGYTAKGNNLVTVSGAGSVWSNSASLRVGGWLNPVNSDTAVVITNGGHLYSSGGVINSDQPIGGGRVAVTGSGSIWKNTGTLYAGYNGELIISDGGRVENTDAFLFKNSIAEPVTVTGSGSTWICSGQLSIGKNANLMISDGGRVESHTANISGVDADGSAVATVTGTDSTWVNSDQLNVNGGGELMISDGGRVESGSGGVGDGGNVTVAGAGSIWNNVGVLTGGSGSITISNGGTVSTASLALPSAYNALHLQSGGKLNISSDFDADQPGTFDFSGGTLSVGGTLSNFSLLESGCRLEACDLAGDLTVHGTFAPGQSPADTMLDGAFVVAGDGTLEMELAGYLLGTEYDRLTVTGESTLDGTLALVLLDDFAPVYGAAFDLFNWDGGVSGTFAATNLPTLANGLFWDTGSLYTDGTVTVVPEPSTFLLLGMGLAAFGIYALRSKVYEF